MASETLVISCDGSYFASLGLSGWGFTVARQGIQRLCDFSGSTVIDPHAADFIGATAHSNNVGELLALIYAMSWLQQYGMEFRCVIEYDSEFAAQTVQRIYNTRSHLGLVLKARRLHDALSNQIFWRKVSSHTGQYLNDRADHLAKCGAVGIFVGQRDITAWAIALNR